MSFIYSYHINKFIKNLLSFTWFVFCVIPLTYAAALLSCTELVCARANLNYAIFFLTIIIFDKGGSSFMKRCEHPARNRSELSSSSSLPFCNQNRNKRKLDNVRIHSPVWILRRNVFVTEFELFLRVFFIVTPAARYSGKYTPHFTRTPWIIISYSLIYLCSQLYCGLPVAWVQIWSSLKAISYLESSFLTAQAWRN